MNKIEIGTKCIIAHYDFLEDKNQSFYKVAEISKITPKRFYTNNGQRFSRETLGNIDKPEYYNKFDKIFFYDSESVLEKRLELVKKRNYISHSSYKLDFNKLSDSEIDSLFNILDKGCKKS